MAPTALLTNGGVSNQGSWVRLPVSVGEVTFAEQTRPCDVFLDAIVTCRRARDISCIVFQNNYTAAIILEQRIEACLGGASTDGVISSNVVLPEHTLMHDANCEDDAQAWHAIYQQQFSQALRDQLPCIGQNGGNGGSGGGIDAPDRALSRHDGISLRFHLLQPSPNWPVFNLLRLRVYQFVPIQGVRQEHLPRGMTGRLFGDVGNRLRQLHLRLSAEEEDRRSVEEQLQTVREVHLPQRRVAG